jgi:hypothetical protein
VYHIIAIGAKVSFKHRRGTRLSAPKIIHSRNSLKICIILSIKSERNND